VTIDFVIPGEINVIRRIIGESEELVRVVCVVSSLTLIMHHI